MHCKYHKYTFLMGGPTEELFLRFLFCCLASAFFFLITAKATSSSSSSSPAAADLTVPFCFILDFIFVPRFSDPFVRLCDFFSFLAALFKLDRTMSSSSSEMQFCSSANGMSLSASLGSSAVLLKPFLLGLSYFLLKLVGDKCFRFLGDTSPFSFFMEPGFDIESFSCENPFCTHIALIKLFSRTPDRLPSKMCLAYNIKLSWSAMKSPRQNDKWNSQI